MGAVATTKMSSRGQVVIPEDVRKSLGLEPGARFVVMGERDTIVLKLISTPSREHIRNLLEKVRAQARRAGVTQKDVRAAIRHVRRQNRRSSSTRTS